MDLRKIRGLIVEKYGTMQAFACAVNTNQSQMSKYLTGKSKWPFDLIVATVKALDIPKEKIGDIFFADIVA